MVHRKRAVELVISRNSPATKSDVRLESTACWRAGENSVGLSGVTSMDAL